MKIKSILVILLLMSFSLILASEDPAEVEHWEKVRQLDQLAEKFKAETGFRGSVEHSTITMRLHVYQGNFPGITFTADGDTTAFRQACEGIISKVLPNSRASSTQLSVSRISKSGRGFTTNYYQHVDGYRVEGAGYIMITFDDGRKYFAISDNTVDLPKNVMVILSLNQAIEIAKGVYHPEYLQDKSIAFSDPVTRLLFAQNPNNLNANDYCLYYKISFWGLSIYVDPSNGNVAFTKSLLVEDYNGHAEGYAYKADYTTTNIDSLGYKGAHKVTFELENNGDSFPYVTDLNGNVLIQESTYDSLRVLLQNEELYRLVAYPDTTLVVHADSLYAVQDSLIATFKDDNASSYNVYHHITNQYYALQNYIDFYIQGYRIMTNMPNSNSYLGRFDPQFNVIRLVTDAGKYSHVARHEMSHVFIFSVLGEHFFNDTGVPDSLGAMDEALATYLPCSVINSQYYINTSDSVHDLSYSHINNEYQNINEAVYSYYFNRYPIASAWWSLRGNQNFPSDNQGRNGVDALLVHSLEKVKDDLPINSAYRYKPRYFYNILMSQVDTDGSSWPLNNKQLAINKAYNDRGFHFYPTVESIAGSSTPIAQSFYNPGDSVYVHIKDCPQNTKVGIRVVPDVDTYTQIGAGGIAIPSAVNIGGNSVFREVKTNENGEWKGSIYFSNQLSPGEYDIIVDMGSPTTPDNRLNLVFAKDNIIDAVDGLNGVGFTVTNLGDAVVALDLSSSMDGYGLQQTASIPTIHRK